MEIREEIITVNATVKIKGKFPARLNKHSNLEDEKRITRCDCGEPRKELMNENFEFVDLIEVD